MNSGAGTPLTVSGLSLPAGFTGNWTGTLAPGASANATISFRPTARRGYFGAITVNANVTSGPTTVAINGEGQ